MGESQSHNGTGTLTKAFLLPPVRSQITLSTELFQLTAHLVFPVIQQPKSGLRCLVLKSLSHTYTNPVGHFATKVAIYTAHDKHKRGTHMPSVVSETVISTIKRLQTYASDHTATEIGHCTTHWLIRKYLKLALCALQHSFHIRNTVLR